MGRIDEIKDRLSYFPCELKDGGFSDNSLAYGARLDIEYLLSKLEIAEKALELYAERTNWRASLHYDKVNMRRTDIHGFMDVDPWEIADKTLQQIRS